MQKLTFTNKNGDSFVLGYSKPYLLSQLSGITDVPVSIQSEKGYGQDGETTTAVVLGKRTIAIAVTVFGSSAENVYQNRRNLIKFFNPKVGELTILYENSFMAKVITGRVQQIPTVGPLEDGRGGKFQKAVMAIQCDMPFFADATETIKELALKLNLWELPASIPQSGIEFGVVTNKKLTIINDGDVDTPIMIEWIGTVLNPQIMNETIGQYIKVNVELLEGEKLTINTEYGNKTVTKTDAAGNKTNAFGLIDLSSDFFSLIAGENLISYSADTGADESTLFIHYKNRFVGV